MLLSDIPRLGTVVKLRDRLFNITNIFSILADYFL